jgi:hypothetical protein
MSTYDPDHRTSSAPRPRVDARTLWAGGLASAVVAALIALVGVLILRGVFDIHVLAPEEEGTWGDASTAQLAVAAAIAALVATGLVHLLLISTPRAMSFFVWIMGLGIVAAAIAPFATDASTSTQLATGAIYLVIGVAILSLVSGVARMAVSRGTQNA